MTNPPDADDRAEQVLTRVMRNLPPRRAPAGLQARVLEQLEHRRSRAWWGRSFADWPAATRAGFIGICFALVGASLVDTRWSTLGAGALRQASGWILSWTYAAVGAAASVTDVVTRIAGTLPSSWLLTIAAAAAALYAALFGLGAVAYRTLYLSPSPRQVIR